MNINRRKLTGLAALATLFCTVSAFAQSEPSKPADKRPFRSVNVNEDGRRVLFFFDFACPYSAAYHEPIVKWAATVPKTVQSMFIPIVNVSDIARKNEQILVAGCYYSALSLASKEQMNRFSLSVYDSRARGEPLVSKAIWMKALKVAGLDDQQFGATLKSKGTELQVQLAARKTLQYALLATPSIGVGGKYVITPDDVLGDEAMFFNILNGLTSEIL
jgi:thiol:disulfide interchange protein DsbA